MPKRMIALRMQKQELVNQMQGIMAAAEKAGSDKLTRSQERDFDSLERQLKTVDAELAAEKRLWDEASGETNPYFEEGIQQGERVEARSGGLTLLKPEQRMADLFRTRPMNSGLSFDRWLRGTVTGDWRGAERELAEVREMNLGTPGAGGYTVPEPLALNVIDLVRNKAQVMRAGAQTVPMTSNTLRIGRLASDPTAEWKAENADSTASDMSFEAVDFTAHTLIARTKASVELVEDSPGLNVESSIAAALALALDAAALRGTGLNDQPKGILAQTGVTLTALGAADGDTPTYGDISMAVERRQGANHEAATMLAAPRTYGTFDRLVDLQGQPLRPFQSWEKLQKLATSQIPVNLVKGGSNDCSEIYIGDFRYLLVGMRTGLTIEISRAASDAVSSAFSKLQVWVRAYLRADIQLAHPSAFEVITAVRP